jgi:hypothetical protein
MEITGKFFAMTRVPATAVHGWLNIGLTATLLACAAVILVSVARRWYVALAGRGPATAGA